MTVLDRRLVLAPMAGGPGTVALAAAVASAGGFPFLPGGYLTADRLRSDIEELRTAIGGQAFGVNLFAPTPARPDRLPAVEAYAAELAPWAELAGVGLGEPRHDDDDFDAKVELVLELRPALVSFAFGWPADEVVERLEDRGIEAWVTVNDPDEVAWATALGVSGIIAQGWGAGGHRGGPVDSNDEQLRASRLLTEVLARADVPVIAAGGVSTPDQVSSLLGRGARAVACGTAYLCADEAGTAEVHRHALTSRTGTVVTRAFTGRRGRALRTSWTDLFDAKAPSAYPEVHHLTAPLRAHGRATGQPELVNLWAGIGHESVRSAPAGEITRELLEGAG